MLVNAFCAAAAALAQATVLGKLVYDITGSELDLGLLGLAEFLPAFLLVVVAGTVVDRVDRRRVVAWGGGAEALVAIALGWYAGTRPTSVVPIFGLVLVFGVARAFANPAGRSLPADLVAPERLPWLTARYAGAWQVAIIVGPVMGGFLYAADVRLPFLGIAALAGVGSASVMFVPRRTIRAQAGAPAADPAAAALEVIAESGPEGSGLPAGAGGFREATEGLRFVRSNPLLLGAISLDLFAVLFGGAVALLPAIAKDRLGVGVVGLGWLRAATGIGAGLVTASLAVRPVRRRIGTTLLAVVAIFGIFTIVLGVTRSFTVAFIALLVASGADAISVFIRATLVPLVTPQDKRGRVLAVENVFIGASNELGAFESGVAGQLIGTSGSVVLGGVATLAVALGWAALFPSLRKVDRFPGDEQPAGG